MPVAEPGRSPGADPSESDPPAWSWGRGWRAPDGLVDTGRVAASSSKAANEGDCSEPWLMWLSAEPAGLSSGSKPTRPPPPKKSLSGIVDPVRPLSGAGSGAGVRPTGRPETTASESVALPSTATGAGRVPERQLRSRRPRRGVGRGARRPGAARPRGKSAVSGVSADPAGKRRQAGSLAIAPATGGPSGTGPESPSSSARRSEGMGAAQDRRSQAESDQMPSWAVEQASWKAMALTGNGAGGGAKGREGRPRGVGGGLGRPQGRRWSGRVTS
mmetsp:Transcript_237/g.712  ORF Transcript_237/g.712 Transcript_237/m.712 type:complete len:273 (+) Transcript_237:1754-2572(+)